MLCLCICRNWGCCVLENNINIFINEFKLVYVRPLGKCILTQGSPVGNYLLCCFDYLLSIMLSPLTQVAVLPWLFAVFRSPLKCFQFRCPSGMLR